MYRSGCMLSNLSLFVSKWRVEDSLEQLVSKVPSMSVSLKSAKGKLII